MASDMTCFPLSKVKAYRAYFTECRAAAKGTPEFADLDVAVRLCEQLAALLSEQEPKPNKKASAPAA